MTFRLAALALESAISAQLVLFCIFLLSNHLRGPALSLLAGLSGTLAAMAGANLLASAAGGPRLGDAVLFLDLVAPALVYLYVRQIRWPAPALHGTDLLHVLPATAGLTAWKAGLLSSMDVYVILCWTGYLAIAGYRFVRDLDAYQPRMLRRFIVELLAALGAITALRVVMALQALEGRPFRDGAPYLVVLAATLAVTCRLLFTALRYPNLLSLPGSYARYAAPKAQDTALEQRLAALLRDRKPYLNPDLTLAEIALMLDVPARQVSQLVNARFKTNVSAFINQHRVQEAARLLCEEPDKPIKVVMFESGFKSKSIFNREFQRRMGKSPSEHRAGAH